MSLTPRTALVVVVAAIALLATAGAGATAALMISGKQIKDSSVTSQDIKNRSLKVKDLSTKAQTKLKGRTGATGTPGTAGAAGPAGPAGAGGAKGEQGLTGPQGDRGLQGLQGLQGLTGPQGLQGLPGLTGLTGPQGDQGLPGLPGLSGLEVIPAQVLVPILSDPRSVVATCPAGKKAISATAGFADAPLGLLGSLFSRVTRTSDTSYTASGLNVLLTGSSQLLTLNVVCATVAS